MVTFNVEQQQLIDAPLTTPVAGVASAGTGKTTVVLARAKRILKEYTTGRVLLISFTRNAAKDMQDRLFSTLGEQDKRRVLIGTFHAIIGKCIRDNAVAVGLQPSFSIIDDSSTATMYRTVIEREPEYMQVMNHWFLSESHKTLTKKDFNKVANLVSALVNTALPEELETGNFSDETKYRMSKADDYITPATYDEVMPFLHKVFIGSIQEGRTTNTVNYDHILFIGYLMCKSGMLDAFSNSLAHMIVDEYQDTNALQDYFVRTVGKNNLTIIGDVDQAIYEFRGGRSDLMEQIANEGIRINLKTNYRSYQPILDVANRIIDFNDSGRSIREPMVSARPLDENYKGMLEVQANRDTQEADYVIAEIEWLMKHGIKPSDIAILVRSRMTMPAINQALGKSKIPVNDTTKFADFMNSEVMKDALNFIKVFTNPKDIYAFMGILDRPKRGIGPKAIATLEEKAKENNLSIVEFLLSEEVDTLTPALRKNVQNFIDVYQNLISPQNHMTFPQAVNYLLTETGYISWIKGLKNNESHLRNLDILKGMVEDFTYDFIVNQPNASLYDIANNFTFEMTSSARQEDNDGVCIATLHGSKGLEWDYGYILGMENDIFPGTKVNDQADMESERRLMYVGVTRFKKALRLCYSKHRMTFGMDRDLTRSEFLSEAALPQTKDVSYGW